LSPGDLLKIRLVNQLPPDPAAAHWQDDGNAFLALNPTNLHTHGMHQISAGLSGIITIRQISDCAIDIGPQADSSELLISGRGSDFNLFGVQERTALPPTELARRSCI